MRATSRRLQGPVNPYGHEFHGNRRGAVATLPEPTEVWLKLLACAMPFRADGVCVGGTDAMAKRAGTYFRNMRRADTGDRFLQPFGPASQDVVVAQGRVLSGGLDAVPRLITDVHQALRPHGVFAVLSHTRGRVIGPPEVAEDYEEMLEAVSAADDAGDEALETGFANVYFPHSNVQRAWFTAEYPVSLPHLCGFVRGWPAYQRFVAPTHEEKAPGCVRLQQDPLDALELSIGAQLDRLGGKELQHVARLQVDFCLLVCDNRGANRLTSEEWNAVPQALR